MRRKLLIVIVIVASIVLAIYPWHSLANSTNVEAHILSGPLSFNWGDTPQFRLEVCAPKGTQVWIPPWLIPVDSGISYFDRDGCVQASFAVNGEFYAASDTLGVLPLNGLIPPEIVSEVYKGTFYLPTVFVDKGDNVYIPVPGSYVTIKRVPPQLFDHPVSDDGSRYVITFKHEGNALVLADNDFPVGYQVFNPFWIPFSFVSSCGRIKVTSGDDAVRFGEHGVIEVASSFRSVEFALSGCPNQESLISWAKGFALSVLRDEDMNTDEISIDTFLPEGMPFDGVLFWYGPDFLLWKIAPLPVNGISIRVVSNGGTGGQGGTDQQGAGKGEEDRCEDVSSPVLDRYIKSGIPFVAATVGRKCIITYDGQSKPRHVATDAPVIIEDGRTLVPMRFFLEAINALIWWVPAQRKVIAVVPQRDYGGDFWRYSVKIEMWIGNPKARVNGQVMELPSSVPPRIISGRTYVPLRFVGEVSGWQVEWDAQDRLAIIHR